MAGPQLFDFLNDLNVNKKNLLATEDPDVRKAFDPFMTRRGLAQSIDTIVIAERLNQRHSIDPWMQWCYAFYSITPKKRYAKWAKASPVDDGLKMLSNYFQISLEKAADFLRFLPETAINEIRQSIENEALNEKAKPRKAK